MLNGVAPIKVHLYRKCTLALARVAGAEGVFGIMLHGVGLINVTSWEKAKGR
jgi:hypothetical protein